MRKLLALALAATSLVASGVTVSSSTVPTPGVWNSNFATSKSYAEANNIPMVVFWGSAGCPKCKALRAAVENADFTNWQRTQQMVMVFVEGESTPDARSCKAFVKNSSLLWPYCGVYWKKVDGSTVKSVFTGRSNTFPASGKTLQDKFMNTVMANVSGWNPGGNITPSPTPPSPQPPSPPEIVIGSEWNKARTITAGVYNGTVLCGLVEVKTGRKNSANVAKISAKAKILPNSSVYFLSQSIKLASSESITLNRSGSVAALNIADFSGTLTIGGKTYSVKPVTMGGTAKHSLSFQFTGDMPQSIKGYPVLDEFLPEELSFNGDKKWTLPRAGRVTYDRKSGEYIASNGNPSALKLTYTSNNGYFKGNFSVYLEKAAGRLQKVSAKVTGYFSQKDGGDGIVTITGVGAIPCRVEIND